MEMGMTLLRFVVVEALVVLLLLFVLLVLILGVVAALCLRV
jgi:hypothetical protein